MKNKIILYLACSLDGYIARKDGGIDWLPNDDKDYGYTKFYSKIGTVIMGNETYKLAKSFGEKFPGVDVYVFTHSKYNDKNINFVQGDVKEFIENLKPKNNKPIWLEGGSNLIIQFLKYDLIDEFIITIIPVLIGSGMPLFNAQDMKDKKLKLLSIKKFDTGLVQLHYKRVRKLI